MTEGPEDKSALRDKYDRLAGRYSARYADAVSVARRQVGLVASWGTAIQPGARVLEFGCADGFVTEALVRSGYEVTAVDLSSEMVKRARQRLSRSGLRARVEVGDLDAYQLDAPYDVVLAMMGTFFRYADDPAAVLGRWGPSVRTKLLVDMDPRSMSRLQACRTLRAAGWSRVDWRPFLVLHRIRMPRPITQVLSGLERVPGLRAAHLPWRGNVILKGERVSP